ncbi:hypothetical protein WK56_30160 [Burkholderia ubonensis]|uniref:ribosome modulation factor n=1 Tax=Burkholderia ubonensis TaxID=101571 RepID=UPI00075EAA7C|nr:hypothetical protein [Burkholderia ubonensis]KVT66523.1 hypothetical protein WK56_30160 [Burkholderia ubonensis]
MRNSPLQIESADKAYNEGRQAFENGAELADNPYPELSGDWNDWRRGWLDASESDWDGRAF